VTKPVVEMVLRAGEADESVEPGGNATGKDGDDEISTYFPFGGVMHVVYGPWDKCICASCGEVMRARTVVEYWEKNHDDKYNLAGTKEIFEWATTTGEATVAASEAKTKKEGEDILYDAGLLKRRESGSAQATWNTEATRISQRHVPKPTGQAVKPKTEIKSPTRARSDRNKSSRDADKELTMTYLRRGQQPWPLARYFPGRRGRWMGLGRCSTDSKEINDTCGAPHTGQGRIHRALPRSHYELKRRHCGRKVM
jgi:hypothetical protein